MRFLTSVLEKVTRRWMEAHEGTNGKQDGSQGLARIEPLQLFLPKPKVKSPRMKAKVEDSETKVYVENPKDKTKYSLLRRIGTGSISSCYEALRAGKGNFLVLKIVDNNVASSSHQQILNEISHLRRIERHPNIVQFIDSFSDSSGRIILVIERCEHGSLADYLDGGGTLSRHLTANIGRQILRGLQHIHRMNLVHRDLKLGNILLTAQNTIKITDFGLACRLSECQSSTAKLCGTPNYLAPEVCQRKGYSFASDVWSFGVCLYTICTGQVPFHVPAEGSNMGPDEIISQTMGKIVAGRFSISDAIDSIPVRSILVSILVTVPSKRPTVEQLLDSDYFSCGCNPQTCNDKEACHHRARRMYSNNKLVVMITNNVCEGLVSFRGDVQHLVWVKCWGQVTADSLHYVLSNDKRGALQSGLHRISRKPLKPEDDYVFNDLIDFTQQLDLDLKSFYSSSSSTEALDTTKTTMSAWHYCSDGTIGFLFSSGAWQVNFADHVKLLIYRNLVVIISGSYGSHENFFNWLREEENRKYLRPLCEITQVFCACLGSEK